MSDQPVDPLISECEQSRLSGRARRTLMKAEKRFGIERLSHIRPDTTMDGVEGCGPATWCELMCWANAERLRLALATLTCPRCGHRFCPDDPGCKEGS